MQTKLIICIVGIEQSQDPLKEQEAKSLQVQVPQ